MSVGTTEVHVAVRAEAEIGEGPVLDARTGELCWVDIAGGHLVRSDLGRGVDRRWELGTMLGAAVPRAVEPGFAVAVAEGFGLVVDGACCTAGTAGHRAPSCARA